MSVVLTHWSPPKAARAPANGSVTIRRRGTVSGRIIGLDGPVAGNVSFDDFARTEATALTRLAYLMTGDKGAAEDLVQEVLEKMYVKWRRIDTPRAYARKALSRRVTDRWRRIKARPPEVFSDQLPDSAVDDGATARAERDKVVTALATLPPRQRAVLVLRYYEDYSEKQIAETLGCAPGTVKAHAAKGTAALRDILGGTDE